MKKAVIEVDSSQLLDALEQLPQNDLKKLIDTLFLKRLFKKPDFDDVLAKTKRVVKKQRINPEIVEDAIKWAKKQK